MKLPTKVITYLKDTNTIEWKKVGREVLFEEISIQQFEKTFNRDDYITYRECSKQLDELGFSSFRDNRVNVYFHPLHIYLNTKTLIEGSNDIPSEYQLVIKEFGNTQYVSKKSFSKTSKWLKSEYEKLNPPLTQSEIEKLKQQLEEKKKKQHPYQKRIPKFVKSV